MYIHVCVHNEINSKAIQADVMENCFVLVLVHVYIPQLTQDELWFEQVGLFLKVRLYTSADQRIEEEF